jgi:signal transduction histidine kinase
MRSLRTRLLLAVGLVVVAAVAAVGLYSSHVARSAFVGLQVEEEVVVHPGPTGAPEEARTERTRTVRRVPRSGLDPGLGSGEPASGVDRFMDSFNRTVLAGVLLAGLLALGATALLADRLVRPLRSLTRAAGRMAEGDLGQRVAVGSRDEVGRLAAAFNGMAEGLERLERSRRELVHDVAHELRTPLTTLRCQIEAIEDGLVPPDAAVLGSLHQEVALLGRLVDDLQELALATAGRLALDPVTVELASEVERAVRAIGAGGAASLAIEIQVPGGLRASADPARLQQILRNLLANARRHTPAGGKVRVTARALDDRRVEVAVEDEGPGIPPEHLPHLFDRFYRVDPSRTRTTGGTGLGLAIVKQLVEAHGGRVGADSGPPRPEGGSRFWFTLPRGPLPSVTGIALTPDARAVVLAWIPTVKSSPNDLGVVAGTLC